MLYPPRLTHSFSAELRVESREPRWALNLTVPRSRGSTPRAGRSRGGKGVGGGGVSFSLSLRETAPHRAPDSCVNSPL